MCFNHELHEFSRIGSGFAGEFPCRLYSCFLAQFVDQWAVLGMSGEPRGTSAFPWRGNPGSHRQPLQEMIRKKTCLML